MAGAYLVDEGSQTAKRLGLLEGAQKDGEEVPSPVSLLVDAEGILRYVSRPFDFTSFTNTSKVVQLLEAPAAA